MTYFEKAAGAIPTTRRKRFGDGMMEPLRALEFKDPGDGVAAGSIPGRF